MLGRHEGVPLSIAFEICDVGIKRSQGWTEIGIARTGRNSGRSQKILESGHTASRVRKEREHGRGLSAVGALGRPVVGDKDYLEVAGRGSTKGWRNRIGQTLRMDWSLETVRKHFKVSEMT